MKRHEVPQLPQDSHFGALPNAPGMLGSSAELVRTQKCQQAGNDHEGWWKAEGEQKQMSDTKHTPGPWRYGKRGDGSKWLSLGNPATGPHYQGDLWASDYDAKLIVAAPDLLAALKDCQERQYNPFEPDSQSSLYVRCAAIIKKVEGRL